MSLAEKRDYFEPPKRDGVDWIKVDFETALSHILLKFKKDIPSLDNQFDDLILYEFKAMGPLSNQNNSQLRVRIENLFLKHSGLQLKECMGCNRLRIVRGANGRVDYRSERSDPDFRRKVMEKYGSKNLAILEQIFDQEQLILRFKVINGENNNILWAQEYVYNSRTHIDKYGDLAFKDVKSGKTGTDGSNRSLIGEIAFKTVLSPGFASIPSIDVGGGSRRVIQPTVDISLGERYDQGHKEFGFVLGFHMNMSENGAEEEIPPFLVRLAPQFKYVINPLNTTSARWALNTEVGGMIGSGLTAFFVGFGPEVRMINRFSVSFIPAYIFNTEVTTPPLTIRDENGETETLPQERIGQFGGLALMLRANFNW